MCISGAAVLTPHTVLDLAQESRLWAVSHAFVACLGLPSLRRCSVAPYGSRWTSTGPRGVVPTEARRPRGRAGRGPTVAPPPSAVHRRGEHRGGMALSPQPRGCHIHHYCYYT
jgi:hypothetical protein